MVGWQRVLSHSLPQLSEDFPLPLSSLGSPYNFAFLEYSLRYPSQFNPANAHMDVCVIRHVGADYTQ